MSKKIAAVQQEDIDQDEAEVVEAMAQSIELADMLFGAESNLYAERQMYGYLQGSDDQELFMVDLKRTIEHVKKMGKPATPERVFGLFKDIFGDEDE